MSETNYKQMLLTYFAKSSDITDIAIPQTVQKDIDFILSRISSNKGVYTVLVTLSLYKTAHPQQDIRYHKIELPNGFSGRSFDTKYVTPTLKELGIPAMSESGWLTRSLEQAYPFDMDFNGKITPIELKKAFLRVVGAIQESGSSAENILRILLNGGREYSKRNKIAIQRVPSNDIQIDRIVSLLHEHFTKKYDSHGGSKLPMLAFYAIYSVLVPEMNRYVGATLKELGSNTASDRTSSSAGDIEIAKNGNIFEAVEVKLDRTITPQIVRVAYEKINKFGVERYYILSGVEPNPEDIDEINQLIFEIQQEHGCQVIVNGLYHTLKYYLRLISKPQDFINKYIELVENDSELSIMHKNTLKGLLANYFGE
jgi:DNA (cytosine-5)-methyltransferase 1